jgi:MFS family permease
MDDGNSLVTQNESNSQQMGVYYGWWIVFAVFVMLAVSSGLCFYNLPIFLKSLTAEQGLSVNLVSFATATYFVITGVAGIYVAKLMDRYDPRLTFNGGALLAGLGLVLVGRATEPWHIFAAYGVLAVGFSGSAFVPGTALVARWFTKKRSLALSLATSGLSVGGILLTPLSAWMVKTNGLEIATQWMALIYIVGVGPVVTLLVRPSPESMGLYTDGEAAPKDGIRPALTGLTFAEARKTRFYILVTVTFVFALMTQVGAISHLFKLIADRSDLETAALGASILAAASMIGRLLGGWVLGSLSIRLFTVLILLVQSLALASMAYAQSTTALLVGTALFGATVGNALMLLPLLLAEAFGVRDYARIYANSQMMSTFGVAAGPIVLGILYSWSGGYTLSYATVAATALLALVVFLFAGPVPENSLETGHKKSEA